MPRCRVPRALPSAFAAASLAALAAGAVCSMPVHLEPGRPAWASLVRGSGDGVLRQRAVAIVPGLDRSEPRRLIIAAAEAGAVAVAIDAGPRMPVRLRREGVIVPLAAARMPGLRLDVEPLGESAPPRITRLEVEGGARPWRTPAAFAFVLVLLCGLFQGPALGLVAASALALSATPALLWSSLPQPGEVARLGAALLPLVVAASVFARAAASERRAILHGGGLIACAVFGAWVRGYFLPSTGSWDTEYWKAWAQRAVSHGVAGVYGDEDAVPPGTFFAQLRGEGVWKIEWRGRAFPVDYPPLAMALWRWSKLAVDRFALDPEEAWGVAVKLPSILGDLLAWPALLWVLRRRPLEAIWAAALYWALPVSWLSSGVLAFSDGSLGPLLLVAVAAAGDGRPATAGAFLALAALIKPTAAVVAPAMVAALRAARAPVGRAVASGLVVVAVSLVPFALAGTFTTAVVHVYRILFQERLSGGYPNPWWLLGHWLTLGPEGWSAPVKYARIELLPLPARPLGTLLFALAAAVIVRRQRGCSGPGPALLSSSALLFAYGMLGVGVHENHPHPLFLLLLGTGLPSARLRALWAGLSSLYVVNMLAMSGLGRFYGLRHAAIEPLSRLAAGLRHAPGFDLTLLLVALNLALFAWLLRRLREQNHALRG